MDGGDSSPVMTDSERRAYRYGHPAAPRLRGMRKSWSHDSLAGYGGGGRASCVCAPTTHPGSFRCKHHRYAASNLGAAKAEEAPARRRREARRGPGNGAHRRSGGRGQVVAKLLRAAAAFCTFGAVRLHRADVFRPCHFRDFGVKVFLWFCFARLK
ncbi:hypothetical protein BAE44_0006692 [Dichanthelium oligosanthes]|uniref:Uncharacterized protein n=1 Tax=Dichanthelium oligosanthes TaxID=888268 RepID=A0A1E5W4F6_9POAL|nr:hypothetical protein BAE44_0006692 [Dichanthelium oligosanthes]